VRRFLLIIIAIFLVILSTRLPILKTQIGSEDYYFKDVFGFVYARHGNCGLLGGCTYWDVPLYGVHASFFEVLEYNGHGCSNVYAKTPNSVYYYGEKQPQVKDPKTFEILNITYAKDSAGVYKLCRLEPTDDDASSFVLIGPACSKSSTQVTCLGGVVEGADPATFAHIWRGYYRDKDRLYLLGMELKGLDPNTFKLLSWGYAEDTNGIYFIDENYKTYNKVTNADKATFEVMENYSARDSKRMYRKGLEVEKTE